MFEKKTSYFIQIENDKKTSIRLSKVVADALQSEVQDVHLWLQLQYKRVAQISPMYSRRRKGDMVRLMAQELVQNSACFEASIRKYLG